MHDLTERLPEYASSFIGRGQEIAELVRLLANHRLVNIWGVGGSGKTRLAIETARRLAHVDTGCRETTVFWASLANVGEDDFVSQAIADELGVRGAAGPASMAVLCDALADSSGALVMDNCEQVAAGCRGVVVALLAAAPDLRILVTSRVPLRVAAERVYAIPSLDAAGAALELFVDRAAGVAPVYTLTAANREPIAEICARLDGLPLAVELAATRINMMAPRDLLHELTVSLDVLSSTEWSLAERHRSIDAVLSTTWRALGEDQRVVLAGLAIFRGSFTAAAAEAVTDTPVETLEALVEHALIQARTDQGSSPRYQLHELVRTYAASRSAGIDRGRFDRLRRRHFDYFLAVTKQSRTLWNGSQTVDRQGPLWEERDNLDAAMRWALEVGDSNRALLVAGALYAFWTYSWPSENAKRERLELALALPWEPGDPASILARARALTSVGFSWSPIDGARARRYFDEALGWYRQLGHRSGIAWGHSSLGWQSLIEGDVSSAGRHLRESVTIFGSIGHKSGEASCLSDLGQIAVAAGRWTEAETHIAKSMALADELDDDFIRYRAHVMRADMCRLTRRWRDAVAGYERALQIQRDTGINGHGADILEGLGETAAQLGEIELAAELLAAGLAWRRHYQVLRPSFYDHGYAAATTLVQRTLSPETWRQALDIGAKLSPGSVEDVAAAGIKRLKAALEELTCGLSERQVEVLRLVAQGLSNADIAEQLVLSPRTVQTHLRSVFNKLGVTTRTAAAREAVQLGLN